MGTDWSDLGREKRKPYRNAVSVQRVRIVAVDDTDYKFVIEDISNAKAFGPAPGPPGMEKGDIAYAIPVLQGGWILIDPTRIQLII